MSVEPPSRLGRLNLAHAEIDLDAAEVRRGSRVVPLTDLEVRMLAYLHERPGQVVRREVLLDAVWGYHPKVVSRAIDQAALRLRKKIEVNPAEPRVLLRVYGQGYRLVVPRADAGLRPGWPRERDRYLGRDDRLAALDAWLGSGDRQLTVFGPAGIGKTRLVVHWTRTRAAVIPDQAWFCDLSSALDLPAVHARVAEVLGVQLTDGDPGACIAAALRARAPCLLVLDNAEQVAGPAAEAVDAWSSRDVGARVITTSRRLLGLDGERVLEVAGLAGGPGSDCPAASLFQERARAAGREPTPEEAGDIAELVAILDGIPLAIELAAARSRIRSPRQLVMAARERLSWLAVPDPGGAGRHDSLRAALDASWELLTAEAKTALACSSVFSGGFDASAAAAVLGPGALAQLDELAAGAWVSHGAHPERYAMLPTIAAYAAERFADLPEGIRDAAWLAHRVWFADRVGARGRALETAAGAGERAVLAADRANLIAALGDAVRARDVPRAVALLGGVWALLGRSGPYSEAERLARTVVALGEGEELAEAYRLAAQIRAANAGPREALPLAEIALRTTREAERDLALATVASLRRECGDLQGALAAATEALALPSLGGPDMEGRRGIAFGTIGLVEAALGHIPEARAHLAQALVHHRAAANLRHAGFVLTHLATLDRSDGRLDVAIDRLGEALEAHQADGDARFVASAHSNLGLAQVAGGRIDAARASFRAAMEKQRSIGHAAGLAMTLTHVAWLEQGQGRPGRARAACLEALEVASNAQVRSIAAHYLGRLAHDAGRADEAAAWYERALRDARPGRPQAYVLADRARLHRATGELALAADLGARALAIVQAMGDEEAAASVRAMLDAGSKAPDDS